MYSKNDQRKIRRSFPTLAAAKAWRAQATTELHRGLLHAAPRITLREAAKAWDEGAKAGTIKSRRKQPFKPSTVIGYERALAQHVLPDLGGARLGEISRFDLQALVDRLEARGLDGSTVNNVVTAIRVIFRHALRRGILAVNPALGLEISAPAKLPRRVLAPAAAEAFLAALTKADRALWATAFYCGLRRGELFALRVEDIDLGSAVVNVGRSYDDKAKTFGAPKSDAGWRRVPITPLLRDYLDEHLLTCGREKGLVFGADGSHPPVATTLGRRARAAAARAGVDSVTLHEARHTYASLLIAAGVNAKAIATYMGHSSIQVTFDIYGHLMPGNEEEAARLLDDYVTGQMGKPVSRAAVPLSAPPR